MRRSLGDDRRAILSRHRASGGDTDRRMGIDQLTGRHQHLLHFLHGAGIV